MTSSPFGAFTDDPFRGFDTLSGRIFGSRESWPPARPGVQRVDVGRLLSGPARELMLRAVQRAAERGAPDLDVLDLLGAAAQADPGRALLRSAGADPDGLLKQIGERTAGGAPGAAPATLSPAAKRALLDAQRISRVLEASYIGPEHLLLALAANPDSLAARLLAGHGISANELQQALLGEAGKAPAGKARPSATPTLDEYGRDLTEQARQGGLDVVVGREDEIEQAVEVLSRRTRSSPCLIGEPGVGKTAVVEGIAQRIVNGGVPQPLKGKRVVALDLARMVAGSKDISEFEERLRKLVEEILAHSAELVIFIDEMHSLMGAGPAERGLDAVNVLVSALSHADLHVIAATTIEEYRRNFEKDSALDRRFQPILVAEPSVEDTVGILAGLRDAYEAHHQARITDDALDAAAQMSARHIPDRFLPDKAIDLMDQAAARVRLRASIPADDVRELEGRLEALRRDKDQAVAAEDFDRAKELTAEIDRIRPELESARHGHDEVPEVTAIDIAEVVARRTGIPVEQLTREERDRLIRLEEHLHERVIGQEEAVRAVAEAVRRARAGLADPDRPIGAFLFLGPKGVGKSELARALAEALFGDADRMVGLDMHGYREANTLPRLVGAPPDAAGQLTDTVRRRPHSVVLLDSVEKAHPDVITCLVQLLDDGRLTDGQGRTVDFSNAIVIMTSDIGAQRILSNTGPEDTLRADVVQTLHHALRPELLDRIDEVVIFGRLDKPQLRQIVDLLLDPTRRRLKGQGVELEVTDAAREALVESGYQPEYGAGRLRRTLQRDVDGELSRALLSGEVSAGDTATVDYADGGYDYAFAHSK